MASFSLEDEELLLVTAAQRCLNTHTHRGEVRRPSGLHSGTLMGGVFRPGGRVSGSAAPVCPAVTGTAPDSL